jgi:hypothetical protein
MWGQSYREGCPLDIEQLAFIRLSHWDMNGEVAMGELIVARTEADAMVGVFEQLFEVGFPIKSMRLIHEYGGDDDASMADNNTSAFNCRQSAGSSRWSEHSYGAAIDVNPLINPYVTTSGRVMPPEGAPYQDRTLGEPGMIVDGDAIDSAFSEIGWGWGGRWSRSKDYQHFSRSGR